MKTRLMMPNAIKDIIC